MSLISSSISSLIIVSTTSVWQTQTQDRVEEYWHTKTRSKIWKTWGQRSSRPYHNHRWNISAILLIYLIIFIDKSSHVALVLYSQRENCTTPTQEVDQPDTEVDPISPPLLLRLFTISSLLSSFWVCYEPKTVLLYYVIHLLKCSI